MVHKKIISKGRTRVCQACGDWITEYQYRKGKGLCKKCVMMIQ